MLEIDFNVDHPAARYRAGSGALFSFSKGPPGPGLHNSCELPFGFVYTPLAPPDSITPVPCIGESLPPVLCLTCLAYINLYSTFDAVTGIWTCALCGSRNAAPPEALATTLAPALVSPMLEYRQVLPGMGSETNACAMVLVVDRNVPRHEARAIGAVIEPILRHQARDSPLHLGLIVFGKSVSLYHLGVSGMAVCDVFSTNQDLTDSHLRHRPYLATLDASDTETALQALHQCLAAVYGVSEEDDEHQDHGDLSENVPSNRAGSSRMDRLRAQKAARMKGSSTDNPDEGMGGVWSRKNLKSTPSRAFRCTGEAIQCAIDLTSAASSTAARTGRILLFTNGCPNYGDGHVVAESSHRVADVVDTLKIPRSVEYFDIVAKAAAEGGIGIDVMCTGAQELCLPVYQALVDPSAGFVVTHESFATPHLSHNLQYLLKHTFMSQLELGDRESATGERSEVWMQGCIIDIRLPRYDDLFQNV
jgi:hypothetical protein